MRSLGSDLPVCAAPMAGGVTTPALIEAVTDAGGFAFLPAGYRTPDAFAADLAAVRASGCGVNLFVPSPSGIGRAEFRAYADELEPEAAALGLSLAGTEPRDDDDHWAEKIALLRADPVPFVSCTFGLPPVADVRALQRVGTRVLVTVTTVGEAVAASDLGADGLIVQGTDAGGHSGTHDPGRRLTAVTTEALVRDVVGATGLPVVAAGGVDGPAAVRVLVHAGAVAVAVGTLLLRTDEAGTSPVHRAALADPRFSETVITRAFTGRPARALRNGFIDRHGASAPVGYPAVHHLTRDLRAAASRQGDADRVHLWAGTGFRRARPGAAGDMVRGLVSSL